MSSRPAWVAGDFFQTHTHTHGQQPKKTMHKGNRRSPLENTLLTSISLLYLQVPGKWRLGKRLNQARKTPPCSLSLTEHLLACLTQPLPSAPLTCVITESVQHSDEIIQTRPVVRITPKPFLKSVASQGEADEPQGHVPDFVPKVDICGVQHHGLVCKRRDMCALD